MESSSVYLVIYLIIPGLLALVINVSCPFTTVVMNKKVWGEGNYHPKPCSSLEESYLGFYMLGGKVSVSLFLPLLCFFFSRKHEVWFWILPVKRLVFMISSSAMTFCPVTGLAMQSGMQKLWDQLKIGNPYSVISQERRLDNVKETPAGIAAGGYFYWLLYMLLH